MRTLLLVCPVVLLAQSSQPVPPPARVESRGKQIATAEDQQKKTQQRPPEISIAPSAATQTSHVSTRPNTSQTESEPQKTWHDFLRDGFDPPTWPNWALVVVGFGAAWVALKTLSAIKEQGDLARKSLVLTQRPRLHIRRIVIEEPSYAARFLSPVAQEPVFKPGTEVSGTVEVINNGNGAGTVRASYCRVLNAGDPERLPRENPYDSAAGASLISKASLAPGQAALGHFKGKGPSTFQVRYSGQSAAGGTLNLYLTGWIDYADELGLVRRTAFCRRYHSDWDRFVKVDDPDYEYTD